ncbi:kinase-like domain-containing protein [Pavlovales sp. CCMP2436]|nr:kinase-like domain-containing protein [Pavlovales sp. CCMP2436]
MLLPLPSLPAPIPPYAKPRLFTDGAQTARVRKTVPLRMMAAPEPLDEEAPSGSPSEMSPAVALKRFMPQMSEFEKGEILAYSNVWYCGQAASKIGATFAQTANNHGYDDERGDYNVVMRDHVAYRYEVVSALGKGSFGQVVKVIDHRTQQMLALKVIRNKKRFHQQALVEVRILEYVKEHDPEDVTNAIKFRECFYFRSHLCITFELMSLNLYEFIKANNFQGVSLPLIRRFALQLLTTLRYLRRHRVIHCDLKPENILLKHPSKSGIKVIDFGSSCFEDQRMYTYIQSRFYRAPEVLLGLPYHCAIDMWSFGCILAELFTGYPIFPGENEKEQLACVMEVLGLPPKRMLDASSRASTFFEADGSARLVTNSRGRERRPATKSLVTALRCNDASFVSFLEGCLRWNAADRLTPDAALQHPFVTERARPTSPAIAGFANGRRQHLLAAAARAQAAGADAAHAAAAAATSVAGAAAAAAAAGAAAAAMAAAAADAANAATAAATSVAPSPAAATAAAAAPATAAARAAARGAA